MRLGAEDPKFPMFTDEEIAAYGQDLSRRLTAIQQLDLVEQERQTALAAQMNAAQAEAGQIRSANELTRFAMFFAAGLGALVAGVLLFGKPRRRSPR